MFDDKRSKKVIFVAHCVLNQNVKPDKCAHYPGAITEVIGLFMKEGIGITQMSCPELLFLGLDRQAPCSCQSTVEEEETRVGEILSDYEGSEICKFLAMSSAYQIEEYIKNGFEVLGVIGINGAPTCGVEITWIDGAEHPGQGVFIQELIQILSERGINVPLRGIKSDMPEEAVAICEKLISDSKK